MEKKKVYIENEIIEKVLFELKEIKDCCAEDTLKIRMSKVIKMLSKASDCNTENLLEDVIYEEMKESMTKNPELHSKLYMLYRSLTDGKISEEAAKQLFETYLQMYPTDTIIY
ncbi:hypothetical protein [Clostridium sp. ZS2-4]|uniref:hypothetical protein n=1 Tax=Clostridium sp. ZS2-4 TaxID=2987703 RepID=UPI00227D4635|nr:hypothetical protein [Clostridium sp. ZS2-4]MCY6356484.1 hypothetical protein [Clostridium sp. ZS2-4]